MRGYYAIDAAAFTLPDLRAIAGIRQKALIADEDRALRAILTYTLESYGLQVVCCEGGAEILSLTGTNEFDYIIADFSLPSLKSPGLIRLLRERFPQTVIIGMSTGDRGVEFLSAGVNDFLKKPFVPYDLAMMIDGGNMP